jgi:L-threonylcarbamoyladenylate synthase
MPAIHSWQPNESCDLVIRHLVEGKCVALPSEATYEIVASALQPDAVASLRSFAPENPLTIIVGDYANLFDWLPLLRGEGPRIFRKMGAGPITLSADAGFANGLLAQLPDATRRLLTHDGRIVIRWPSHAIWDELRLANLPLVSIPIPGGTTAAETAQLTGDRVACIIDAGETQFGAVPSLVQAEGRRCRVVRENAVTREQVDDLALCRILFICTGNTCRSPMAEVLCAKLLADHLGCVPGELNQHGFCVQSAGLAAMMGSEASPDAVRVVADLGADLSRHRSRAATMEMLLWADYIFTMTASHAYALLPVTQIQTPQLLSPAGDDVADPIGGALSDYRTCAEQIIQYLQQRLPELLEA